MGRLTRCYVSTHPPHSGRPDGSGYFRVMAEVLSVGAGDEPVSAMTLLPGDGQFLPMQRFDLGILLKPGYQPSSVRGSVNGHNHDNRFSRCYPGGGSDTTGHFMICPDADTLLDPMSPVSRVTVDVIMKDGTTESDKVMWELLQP